jgi:hypothetical protein
MRLVGLGSSSRGSLECVAAMPEPEGSGAEAPRCDVPEGGRSERARRAALRPSSARRRSRTGVPWPRARDSAEAGGGGAGLRRMRRVPRPSASHTRRSGSWPMPAHPIRSSARGSGRLRHRCRARSHREGAPGAARGHSTRRRRAPRACSTGLEPHGRPRAASSSRMPPPSRGPGNSNSSGPRGPGWSTPPRQGRSAGRPGTPPGSLRGGDVRARTPA